MKICSRCHQQKEERDFQIRRASRDGLTAACRACPAEYEKSARDCHIEYQQGENINHRNAAENGVTQPKAVHSEQPMERKAHIIVGNFLRDGKLIRPPQCECCGSECKPQAHHCDYSKPTDVMWLCKSCHVEWHKHNKPIYPDEEPVTLPFPRHAIHAI